MKKKIILGISLIILIFSLIYFFYSKSSYKKNLLKTEKVDLIKKKSVEVIEEKIESSNIIQDVSYSAKDTKGNEYFLKAGEGTIDQNQSNYIFLKSVKGVINLKDYELIEIKIPHKFNLPEHKISTLKDIWYGHEINKVRKLHVEKKIEEVTICKKCPFKDTYDWKQIN